MGKHEFYDIKIIDNQTVKWIPGSCGKFAADIYGNVYALKNGKLMKKIGNPNKFGYIHYGGIMIDGKERAIYAHTLIAETFIGPKPGENYFVHHKNGILYDNRAENLEWMTAKQCSILYHTKIKEQGTKLEKPRFRKEYPIKEIDDNGNCLRSFNSIKDAARIMAEEEGNPEKWNSIATQLSYHLNKKYGSKSVRGKQFRFIDDNEGWIKQEPEDYSKQEKEIMDNMRKAFIEQNRRRKKEIKDEEIENQSVTGETKTVLIHKYIPALKVRVDFEAEADFAGRVDLAKI